MANGGFVNYQSFKYPEEIRDLVRSSNHNISGLLKNDTYTHFVESVDDRIMKNLIDIQEELFPGDVYDEKKLNYIFNNSKDVSILTVDLGDDLIGCSLSHDDGSLGKGAYLCDGLAVRKAYQGRGLGSALMKLGMVFTNRLGYDGLFLFSSDNNRSFFDRLGFRQQKEKSSPGKFAMYKEIDDQYVTKTIKTFKSQ